MAMKAGADSRDLVPPLLRDQVFRRYWGASTVSMFGDQVSSVAVPLTAVLVLHAQAYEMGVLTALEWLPSLLFGLHAGAWVDRRGKRRNAMILADLGRAAAFATIPLCYALHVLTLRADVRGDVRRRARFPCCSPCPTGRCSCRSWSRTSTSTGSR